MNTGRARSSVTKIVANEGQTDEVTGTQPRASLEPKVVPVVAAAPAKPKSKRRLILLAIAAVVASGFGYHVWSRWYIESTDDAQVDAELAGVAARSGGTVSAVYFAENQAVHRGELLAEIDAAPARAKLAQAEANVSAAEAAAHAADVQVELVSRNAQTDLALATAGLRTSSLGADSTQSQIAQAHAGVDSARARLKEASQNLTRVERLYAQGAASDAQRDEATSTRD